MKNGLDLQTPQRIITNRNDELDTIIQILQVYNPRISEILSLTKSQIVPGRFAFLHGNKGSADIIIRDRTIVSALVTLSQSRKDKIFVYTSYYNVYSYIRNFMPHIIEQVRHKKNLRVTHAFRYLNAKVNAEEKTIKAVLHHNSTRSNKYYTNS